MKINFNVIFFLSFHLTFYAEYLYNYATMNKLYISLSCKCLILNIHMNKYSLLGGILNIIFLYCILSELKKYSI